MDPVTHDIPECHVHFYVDFTDSKAPPKDVAETLRSLVVSVDYSKPFMEYPDFIIDNYHFPLKVYDVRAMVVTADFLQSMFDEFKVVAGAKAMIWNLGYMGGYRRIKNIVEFYEVIAKKKLSNYEITKIVLAALRSNGWRVFEISTWNEEKGKFIFRVWNSFESAHIKSKSEEPQCFFIGGVLCGIIKGLTSRELTSTETKCIATGGEYCEFHVKYESTA